MVVLGHLGEGVVEQDEPGDVVPAAVGRALLFGERVVGGGHGGEQRQVGDDLLLALRQWCPAVEPGLLAALPTQHHRHLVPLLVVERVGDELAVRDVGLQRPGFVEAIRQRPPQLALVLLEAQVGAGGEQIDHAGRRRVEFGGAAPAQSHTHLVCGRDGAETLVHEPHEIVRPVHLLGDLACDQALQQFAQRVVLLAVEEARELVVLPRNRPHRGRQRRPARRPGHVDDERERRIGLTFFGVPAGAEGVAALPQRLTDALGAGAVDRGGGTDRVAGAGRGGGVRSGVVRAVGQEAPDGIDHLAQTVGAGRPGDDGPGRRGRAVVFAGDGVEQARCRQHLGQCQPHRLARLDGLYAPGGGGTGRGLRLRPLFDGAVSLAAGGRQAGLHPVQFGPAMVTRGHDRGVLLADAVLDGDEAGAFVAVLRLDPRQGVSFGAEVAGGCPPAARGAAPVVDGSSQSVDTRAAAIQNR